MKIAVIIPHRNAEKWLQRCLDSVSSRFCAVVIDDNVLQRGTALARNQGILGALSQNADYLTFLDADDELAHEAYEQMEAAIKEAPDEPIIQLNHMLVNPDGSKMMRLPNRRGTYELNHLPKLWASSCNKLFKARLVSDIRFPDIRHGEDELFVLECLASARRIYCSERIGLYYHKDNPHSLSKTTTFGDIIDEQVALLEFMDDHRQDRELCEAVRIRQTELWNNPTYKRVIGGGA